MTIKSLGDALGGVTYPGRGLIIGRSSNGKYAVVAYWIMGRSKGSRNRVFKEEDGLIKTTPFDPSIVAGDPSLIIYTALRVAGDTLIVTNGDQTDTIAEGLMAGKTFFESLLSRKYEHDSPNYTPRISSVTTIKAGVMTHALSILKSDDGNPDCVKRFYFTYENPPPGVGRLITTYEHDGNPLPSFRGEPITVAVEGGLDLFTNALWDALDSDNKVSLLVRYVDIESGAQESRIINKNK